MFYTENWCRKYPASHNNFASGPINSSFLSSAAYWIIAAAAVVAFLFGGEGREGKGGGERLCVFSQSACTRGIPAS